jgi:hypothetical protein
VGAKKTGAKKRPFPCFNTLAIQSIMKNTLKSKIQKGLKAFLKTYMRALKKALAYGMFGND